MKLREEIEKIKKDCLNNTPEENKKIYKNYKEFYKCVTAKHGHKLSKEIYDKIDKAWESKDEIKESSVKRKYKTDIMKQGYSEKLADTIMKSNDRMKKVKIIQRKDMMKYLNGVSDLEIKNKMKKFYDNGEDYFYYDVKTGRLSPGSWDK